MANHPTEPAICPRFAGIRRKLLITTALKDQRTLLGNARAAGDLNVRGPLACFQEGDFLVREDDWANDIIFRLAGQVEIAITGFNVAERRAARHIGEMALIDSSQPHFTSTVALLPTI